MLGRRTTSADPGRWISSAVLPAGSFAQYPAGPLQRFVQIAHHSVELQLVDGPGDLADTRPGSESHGQEVAAHQHGTGGLPLHAERARLRQKPLLRLGGELPGPAPAVGPRDPVKELRLELAG